MRGSVLIGSPPTSLWWFYFCTPVSSGCFIQGSRNCICCMWLRRVCSCHPSTCVCRQWRSLVLVRGDVGASDWCPPASSVKVECEQTEVATSGVPGSNNLLKLLLLSLIVSCLALTTITKGPLLCKNRFILLMFSKKKSIFVSQLLMKWCLPDGRDAPFWSSSCFHLLLIPETSQSWTVQPRVIPSRTFKLQRFCHYHCCARLHST